MAGEKNNTTDTPEKAGAEGEEEKITLVTDEDLAERAQAAAPADKSDEDGDDDDEDDSDDTRLGKSEDDDEEAQSKERRRRKSRKERQRLGRERRDRELAFYRNWSEKLEKEIVDLKKEVRGTQRVTLDGRIAQFEAAIKKAENVHADAISAGKGDEAAEALRLRDQFKEGLTQLRSQRGSEDEDAAAAKAPPPPDPRIVTRAQRWVSANPWFDPNRGNFESRIAGAIDDTLAAEGYDPATDEYWEEFDDRIKEVLPNLGKRKARGRTKVNGHDEEDQDGRQDKDTREGKSRGGPAFRSGSQTRTLKKGEFYLSPARVEAMKEAGIWDDPVARDRMARRYAQFDRENSQE